MKITGCSCTYPPLKSKHVHFHFVQFHFSCSCSLRKWRKSLIESLNNLDKISFQVGVTTLMFALGFFNVYSFTQLNIREQFKHSERRCLRDVKKLFKFIQTRDWGSYRCDWRFEKKNLRTFWPRVSLRCYKFIVYDNTFLHFKKPGLYSRVCSCQWNIH